MAVKLYKRTACHWASHWDDCHDVKIVNYRYHDFPLRFSDFSENSEQLKPVPYGKLPLFYNGCRWSIAALTGSAAEMHVFTCPWRPSEATLDLFEAMDAVKSYSVR